MPEQRYAITDRLANVIDAIQLGRKSGVLMIKRKEGESYEKGSITFTAGQIINASVGTLNGPGALQRLRYWMACEFIFALSEANRQTTQPQLPAIPRSLVNKNTRPVPQSSPLFQTPHRTRDVSMAITEMNQRGFSRVHRHIFLLIDGQRSIKDLIVLTGRTPDEVYALLKQLEQAGFIRAQ